MVNSLRVLELIRANLTMSADEGTAHFGYTDDEANVIREFAECLLADIKSYENGYED